MEGVERARARVRELTPLLFNFDLPVMPGFQATPDLNSHFLKAIQDQYNIQIMFRFGEVSFDPFYIIVVCFQTEAEKFPRDYSCGEGMRVGVQQGEGGHHAVDGTPLQGEPADIYPCSLLLTDYRILLAGLLLW